jgi:hypothetical protein
MSKLTKEQWKEIEKKLSGRFGSVELMIDGYKVALQIEQLKRRLVICVYVNGLMCFKEDAEYLEIRRRFWFVRKRFINSAKWRKRVASLSKATRKLLGNDDANKTIEQLLPWFNSFKALKAHLIKNNESIELYTEDRPSPQSSPTRGEEVTATAAEV